MNSIEILTAKETQLYNKLGKTTAINTIHSYLVDTLRTAQSQAVEEASDYTSLANSTPTRLTNIVEIVAVPFKVSRTQQDIQHYQGTNELSRQTEKALMDWANSAELNGQVLGKFSLINGESPLKKDNPHQAIRSPYVQVQRLNKRTLLVEAMR